MHVCVCQVTVPEDHLNAVISDLTSTRRALLSEVTSHGDTRIVTALTPVASLTVSITLDFGV